MKNIKKYIVFDFLYILICLFLFREKSFLFVGIGIIILGVILLYGYNQKK